MRYIVSDEHKFVYFVNQKVACTSIKNALLPLFPIDQEKYMRVAKDGEKRVRAHFAYADSGHLLNGKKFWEASGEGRFNDYFCFGFVRNPWDRLYSCYNQKIQKRGRRGKVLLRHPHGNPRAFWSGMTFAEFVEVIQEIPDNQADVHFRSQHTIFYSSPDDDKPRADFIGRFENLNEDFATAMAKIGIDNPPQLPHLLQSRDGNKNPYTGFYDDGIRGQVAERFADDIELFGYQFD